MNRKGFFLVVEGPDGAGKTTLVAALETRLREAGVEPVTVREPGGTAVAEAIRVELLRDDRRWDPRSELLYFSTARADLVYHVIRPALKAGHLVVSDRFSLSTEAYQIGGRGIPPDEVRGLTEIATGGLRPDLTLVLDVSPETAEARRLQKARLNDRFEREEGGFHRRVAAYYTAAEGPDLVHLDAGFRPERVLQLAWEVLCTRQPDRFQGPPG